MEYLYGETYEVTEELERLRPLLLAATDHGEQNGFWIAYSFWSDDKGWLYIKWELKESEERPIVRYRFGNDGSLIDECIDEKVYDRDMLRGKEPNKPVVVITGDTHRRFNRIIKFCEKFSTTREDIMIILGDVGINSHNDSRDYEIKEQLSKLPITLFCVHGNHERRPGTIDSYQLISWNGGMVYMESKYPNLIFAKDGEIYEIAGKKVMVIGGAYSVDKEYRLAKGYKWFEDEQPSEEIKQYVEKQLEKADWSVDVILSHTTPYQYRPVDRFLSCFDQTTVDDSTERWLEEIEKKSFYDKWYAGHFHCDRTVGKMQIMYRHVELFCGDRDLNFSME